MKQSIEKLKKFFTLEANRSYDNKAVHGGLEAMLDTWEAEARQEQLPEELIQAVRARLRDYNRLTPDSRRDALKGLWNRIRREIGRDITPEAEKQAPQPPEQPKELTPDPATELEVHTPLPDDGELEEDFPPEDVPASPKVDRVEPRPKPDGPPAALDASVTVLDGVGPRNAERLARLGIYTLGDMLYHFPRRYDDYSQLKTINRIEYRDELTILGTVQSVSVRKLHGGKRQLVEAVLSDGTGALRVTWFNQPWITKTLKEGAQIVVAGKVEQYLGRFVITNPEWELLDQKNLHTSRILPVYPLTANISQRWLRTQMDKVVNYWALRVQDPLPDIILQEADLLSLADALLQVHFPDSYQALKAAQHRLAFDEIFYLQLGVVQQKRQWADRTAAIFHLDEEWKQAQYARLPYTLTTAQQNALADIYKDLASGRPMNRLIQGDVGSGKTVVAALGIGVVLQAGAQAAVMAPTSILAEQHYASFSQMLGGEGGLLAPHQIRLMLGATPNSEKEEIRAGLQSGEIRLVIGTHALLEDPVQFHNLQAAVIDEQHRFGVKQRARLRVKGENAHLLVMTATPIPRSLALTVFGDLDLTVIDEMPPGRQPVDTYVLFPRERERIYNLIRREVGQGRQAFIIYPLVEESEKLETKAAVEEYQRLQQEVFRKLKVGLLHGRMKPDEKDAVMTQFRDKEFDILVSTTVVEVGVDVPNANVIVIEGANRFGLAQLHQLRGRVGRRGGKSFCVLIPESEASLENERLAAMVETTDGFVLAEKDLQQRGPGQFLGSRQAGFSEMQMSSLTDVRLIEKARKHAQALLEVDPDLQAPENYHLAATLAQRWAAGEGDIS
ncbi:MAG: ATP-dependent DNA helicase RecG [Anaerolineales bacterium]|nr:ATP-dependent DNA helicase RecG [Anaerolineales bacterium]